MKVRLLLCCCVLVVGLVSCRRTPPLGNLSNDFVVQTKYDNNANFKNYLTYAIRDSIIIIADEIKDSVWFNSDAQSILANINRNMSSRGFVRVGLGAKPDLAVNVIGIKTNNRVIIGGPGWWWGFPGMQNPCFWGACGGLWHYPFLFQVNIRTASFIIEIADLKNYNSSNHNLNIVWTGLGTGQVGTSTSFIVSQVQKTVEQAFLQSPYLTTK